MQRDPELCASYRAVALPPGTHRLQQSLPARAARLLRGAAAGGASQQGAASATARRGLPATEAVLRMSPS